MRTLVNEWRFFCFKWQINLNNQKALRLNFIIQAVAMMINNLAFFTIWIVFSRALGTINGWGTIQIVGALSYSILTMGLLDTVFGSFQSLMDMVPTGRLDALLVKPKSLYLRIISQDFMPSGVGDTAQGLLGLIVYGCWVHAGPLDIMCMILMVPSALIAMISFLYICDCIIFWLPQTPVIGATLMDFMFLPLTQPLSLLRGGLRVFYLIGVPVLLVGGLPIEMVTYQKYELIALSYIISLTWLALSIWFLKISVRRYESGNVIG